MLPSTPQALSRISSGLHTREDDAEHESAALQNSGASSEQLLEHGSSNPSAALSRDAARALSEFDRFALDMRERVSTVERYLALTGFQQGEEDKDEA